MQINKDISILIVDDHQAMRRMLADILRYADFKNVTFAEDGAAAWKKLQECPFDLVFMDWDMPKMTGLETLQKIRADERFAQLPVIMVTARAELDKVKTAIATGATNYVLKPYTPNIIYKKMQEFFKSLAEKD